jgi:hypothetical protein
MCDCDRIFSEKMTLLLAFGLLCKHVNNKRIGLDATTANNNNNNNNNNIIIIILLLLLLLLYLNI